MRISVGLWKMQCLLLMILYLTVSVLLGRRSLNTSESYVLLELIPGEPDYSTMAHSCHHMKYFHVNVQVDENSFFVFFIISNEFVWNHFCNVIVIRLIGPKLIWIALYCEIKPIQAWYQTFCLVI